MRRQPISVKNFDTWFLCILSKATGKTKLGQAISELLAEKVRNFQGYDKVSVNSHIWEGKSPCSRTGWAAACYTVASQ